MSTNVSLPHYIKEHSKAVVVLKLSNDDGDPLIIGSHSDTSHDVKITDIFINNKEVSLATDLASAETCFNDLGVFKHFTHECTIPLYVTASQLGALNFDVSVSTTTNQIFDKHFSTTVKPQGNALLDEPILNFLSAHNNDIFLSHDTQSVTLFNPSVIPLNNVTLSYNDKIVSRQQVIPALATADISLNTDYLSSSLSQGVFTISASNMRDDIQLKTYNSQAFSLNNVYISQPSQRYEMTIIPKHDLKVSAVNIMLPKGVRIDGYNPLFVGGILQANQRYSLWLVADTNSFGSGFISVTGQFDQQTEVYTGKIMVAPIKLQTDVPIFTGNSKSYYFTIYNDSPFAWQGFSQVNFDDNEFVKDQRFSYLPQPQDCLHLTSLKPNEACKLYYSYVPPQKEQQDSEPYYLKINALDSNLQADTEIPVYVKPIGQKFWRFYHKINDTDYLYTLYNGSDTPVSTEILSKGVGVSSQLKRHACEFVNQKVTLASHGVCQFKVEAGSEPATLDIKNNLFNTRDYIFPIYGVLANMGSQIHILLSQDSQDSQTIDVAKLDPKIKSIHSAIADEHGDIYFASDDVSNTLFKYSNEQLFPLTLSQTYPQFLQHLLYIDSMQVILVTSYNPVTKLNSVYQVASDFSSVTKVASFTGSIQSLILVGKEQALLAINTSSNSGVRYITIAQDASKTHIAPLIHLFDSPRYIMALSSQNGLINILVNLMGQLTWYQLSDKGELISRSIEVSNILPYGLLSAITGIGDAFYISNLRSQSGKYLLYFTAGSNVKEVYQSASNYQHMTLANQGVYYSAKNHGGTYDVSQLSPAQEEKAKSNKVMMSLSNNPAFMQSVKKSVISTQDYAVYLPPKITLQEGQNYSLTPVIFPEDKNLGYQWDSAKEVHVVDSTQKTVQIIAPAYRKDHNIYDFKLVVADSKGNKQTVFSSLEVLVDSKKKATANAGLAQSVEEGKTHQILASAVAGEGRSISSYHWRGNGASYLSDPNVLQPIFTAPSYKGGLQDKYELTLSVTDNSGIVSEPSSVIYTVTPDALLEPSVEIVADTQVTEGQKITLEAKATAKGQRSIPEGNYHWLVPEGWEIVGDRNHKQLTVKVPKYTTAGIKGSFKVSVIDSVGAKSAQADHSIEIMADEGLQPKVSLGSDHTVIEGQSITINAVAQAGDGRSISKYQFSGSAVAHLKGQDQERVFTAPSFLGGEDKYQLQVIAIDNTGIQSKPASINIIVTSDSSKDPIVSSISDNKDSEVVEGDEITLIAHAQAGNGRSIPANAYHWLIKNKAWKIDGASDERELHLQAPAYKGSSEDELEMSVFVTDNTQQSSATVHHTIIVMPDSKLKPEIIMVNPLRKVTEGERINVDNIMVQAKGQRQITSYKWIASGGIQLNGSDTLNPSFTAPAYQLNGNEYQLELTVTDSTGQISTKILNYIVEANSTLKPTVTIQGSTEVTESREITLSANAQAKGGRNIPESNYRWQIPKDWVIEGSEVAKNITLRAPAYSGLGQESEIALKVIDSSGISSDQTILTISVNPDDELRPMANAGGNQTIEEGRSYNISGSANPKGSRYIKSYTWSGDGAQHLISGKDTATPVFKAPAYRGRADSYHLSLVVTDNTGVNSAVSTVTYTIQANSSLKPMVTIEGDTQVTESREITLNANAQAKGGRNIPENSYHWLVPKGWVIKGGGTAKHITLKAPAYSGLGQEGEVALTVIDNTGVSSDQTTLSISVDPDDALKPTANAGGNQIIEEGQSRQVSGSGSPKGGRYIKSYTWSGDGAQHLTSGRETAAPVFTAPEYKGVSDSYNLSLVVTDNTGVKSIANTVKYTIQANSSLKPTVTIQGNKQVIENQEITLNANAQAKGGRNIPENNYRWLIPKGWAFIGDQHAKHITLKAPAYSGSGQQGEIGLTVIDSAGVSSDQTTLSISVNPDDTLKPTVVLGGNHSVIEGEKININAIVNAGVGRNIEDYQWSGTAMAHTTGDNTHKQFTAPMFNQGGTNSYALKLTVTDNAGVQTEQSIIINVLENVQLQIAATKPLPENIMINQSYTVQFLLINQGNRIAKGLGNIVFSDGLQQSSSTCSQDLGISNSCEITAVFKTATKGAYTPTIKVVYTNKAQMMASAVSTVATEVEALHWDFAKEGDRRFSGVTLGYKDKFINDNAQLLAYVNVADLQATTNTLVSGLPSKLTDKEATGNPDHTAFSAELKNAQGKVVSFNFKGYRSLIDGSRWFPLNRVIDQMLDKNQMVFQLVKTAAYDQAHAGRYTGHVLMSVKAPDLGYQLTYDVALTVIIYKAPSITMPDNGNITEQTNKALSATVQGDTSAPDQTLSYHWQASDPHIVINNANQLNTSFDVPAYHANGNNQYTFTLTVTNAYGKSSTGQVTYQVTPNDDFLPTVNISGESAIVESQEFTLNAGAQAKGGRSIGNYTWHIPSSWQIISGANQAQVTIKAPQYKSAGQTTNISVEVTDSEGFKANAQHSIAIKPDPALAPSVTLGTDQEILEGQSIRLNAQATAGKGRSIPSNNYYWSASCGNCLSAGNVYNPMFTAPDYNLNSNQYNIQVSVVDDSGQSSSTAFVKYSIKADPQLSPSVKIIGHEATVIGSELILEAQGGAKGKRQLAAQPYLWTIPNNWKLISGSETSAKIVLQAPSVVSNNIISVQVKDSLDFSSSATQEIASVAEPKLGTSMETFSDGKFNLDTRILFYFSNWYIETYGVKFTNDRGTIDDFQNIPISQAQQGVLTWVEGDREIKYSYYYGGGARDDLYHDLKTVAPYFWNWNSTPFDYHLTFKLKNKKYPSLVITRRFDYSVSR
ncbi:hypothetical protein [Cysteiniphilum sp. QT6929]|uniref:hypothetical protein n=1 Tax=Cysteiniphilum sp. QT6929 TaxID=2975055 RepID=UPI0024B372FD|nr:hypothetical protein [Cysteiniphilum sp. QT6929]WHN66055.1 hypothetical protein NYP54_02170 [Cysteiniphilum sp. QT6929]